MPSLHSVVVLAAILCAALVRSSVSHAGTAPTTTIITHGFSPTGKGIWVQSMLEAMIERNGGVGTVYRYMGATGVWTEVAGAGGDGTDAHVFLIFNWEADSASPAGPNWRADGGGFINGLDFDGIPLANVHNVELDESALDCCANTFAHSDVHLWYHGTVDLSQNPSDGEQTISDLARELWYPDGWEEVGYRFAALGGGAAERPSVPDGVDPTPESAPIVYTRVSRSNEPASHLPRRPTRRHRVDRRTRRRHDHGARVTGRPRRRRLRRRRRSRHPAERVGTVRGLRRRSRR